MLWGQVGWVGNNSFVGTEPGPNLVKGRKYRCCMCETSCESDGSSDTFGGFLKNIVEENNDVNIMSTPLPCQNSSPELSLRGLSPPELPPCKLSFNTIGDSK